MDKQKISMGRSGFIVIILFRRGGLLNRVIQCQKLIQIELIMQGAQNGLDITTLDYENLPQPPELNEQLLGRLDNFIKGNWKESHQCITMIRSICKNFPQYIPDIFTKYGPAVLDLISHPTTQLMKNILFMLKEIFAHGIEVNLQGCVAAFLPLLAKKAAMDSGVMKEMCQQVLTIIANKCCYCNTIEITTELSIDKNMPVAELAIKLLAGILNNLSGALTQINPSTLQVIMKGMSFLIHGKRNNMKTSALDVCLFIFNNIGSENYLQLMNYSLDAQDVKDMGEAMQTHRINKPKAPHLSEVLKQQKVQGSQRMSGSWGQNIRM